MDLINFIIVGSLTARVLDSALDMKSRVIGARQKNIKLTNTRPEISKISMVFCQSLKFLQEAYNTVIY